MQEKWIEGEKLQKLKSGLERVYKSGFQIIFRGSEKAEILIVKQRKGIEQIETSIQKS